MSVAEIITEIKRLSPFEQQKVFQEFEKEQTAQRGENEKRADLIARLTTNGTLKSVPNRTRETNLAASRSFKPVPIAGKPLSQTIIEERG